MPTQTTSFERFFTFIERFGIVLTIILLPLDRLPYLHRIPFNLGMISLVALLLACGWRLLEQFRRAGFKSLRPTLIIAGLLALPILGFFIASLDAIDRGVALRLTLSLALVSARAFSFYVLVKAEPALWPIIRKTIYAMTVVVVSFGLFQYFFDTWGANTNVTDLKICCTSNSTYVFPRIHSTALEPLYFDHFLMIPLWLLTFDFWRNKSARRNKKLVALFVITASLFILTIARSAALGLIVAAIVFAVGLRHQNKIKDFFKYAAKLWSAALLLAVTLVLMSGIASIFIDKQAQYDTEGLGSLSKFGSHAVDFDDGSSRTRYELWPRSITYFREDPLTGLGPDNSRIRLNLDDYHRGVPHNRLQPFNNDFLGLMVDTGILGLVSFAPLIATLLYAIYRQFKNRWSHAYAAFAVMLIGMAVQSNFFHSNVLTRTWFVVGMLLITLDEKLPIRYSKRR